MTGAYRRFFRTIEDWAVEPIATILELGSRDGRDAIRMADHFGAEVVSWECNPEAIDLCRARLNHRQDITLVERAAWSADTTLRFFPVVNGNLGASSAFRANHAYPFEKPYQQTEIEVPASRVETWWSENMGERPIDFLAMDLQGAEMEALLGMGDLLDSVRFIVTEGQHQRLYHDTPLIGDLEAFLNERGFALVQSTPANSWFGDFLFIKS